jgi:hypothetical protein
MMKQFKITRSRNAFGEYLLNEGELLYFLNADLLNISQERKLSVLRTALENTFAVFYLPGSTEVTLTIVED